ncbi:MAG: hypothetical protein ACK4NC_01910 [Candidatus Gracilibacteria bacterium]
MTIFSPHAYYTYAKIENEYDEIKDEIETLIEKYVSAPAQDKDIFAKELINLSADMPYIEERYPQIWRELVEWEDLTQTKDEFTALVASKMLSFKKLLKGIAYLPNDLPYLTEKYSILDSYSNIYELLADKYEDVLKSTNESQIEFFLQDRLEDGRAEYAIDSFELVRLKYLVVSLDDQILKNYIIGEAVDSKEQRISLLEEKELNK